MARGASLGPMTGASLEDICGLVGLTRLEISGRTNPGEELPHNISGLTNLKVLQSALKNIKTLPAEMAYGCIQLQKLCLYNCRNLKYLPRSFTCRGAFPALITFQLCCCSRLVEFPEVDEGALPKLRTLDLSDCKSLGSLPLFGDPVQLEKVGFVWL
jgi:Leucine-rich repeat (LRR) protein